MIKAEKIIKPIGLIEKNGEQILWNLRLHI